MDDRLNVAFEAGEIQHSSGTSFGLSGEILSDAKDLFPTLRPRLRLEIPTTSANDSPVHGPIVHPGLGIQVPAASASSQDTPRQTARTIISHTHSSPFAPSYIDPSTTPPSLENLRPGFESHRTTATNLRTAASRSTHRTTVATHSDSSPTGLDPTNTRTVAPSHTNSRTWVNPRMAENEKWLQIHENLKRMELNQRSPCVPHTFNEWMAHRRGIVEDCKADQARKLADLRASSVNYLRERGSRRIKIGHAFGGKRFNDGRSAVLAMPTIWCSWYQPMEERPQAPWPCPEEMKEEGDERKTSGFRRFPGLPRLPGNETVVWKQKALLHALPFDEMWKLPTAESVAAAAFRDPEENIERMEELIGRVLLDAIDCKLDDR